MIEFDNALFTYLNAWMEGGRAFWSPWGASAGALIVAGLVLAFAWSAKRPAIALAALLAFSATDPTCSYLLKPLFARDRPCASMTSVFVPATETGQPICGSGKAMPSNHAANTMAVGIAMNNPFMVLLSLMVGLSRVVLGQHWPSDVAAGWAIGGAIGLGVRTAVDRFFR